MKVFLVTNPVGVFAFTADKNLIKHKLFDRGIKRIVEVLSNPEELIREEKEVIKELSKKGFNEFVFSVKKNVDDPSISFEQDNEIEKFFKKKFREIVIKRLKVFSSNEELNEFLTEVGIALSKKRIKESFGKDYLIAQAVNAWEELNKTINVHVERLREWYGVYFPEMDRLIKDHEKFVELVMKFGKREKIDEKNLKKFVEETVGVELEEEDVKILQQFAKRIYDLFVLRKEIEEYIDGTLKEVAPNLREIAGSMIAAKLIEASGGLEKLARMPSSTIQLLGAEKALFRYLRGRGRSPKYGFIFMSSYIQKAPKKKHGKVARLLAAKLSIAAKLDYFGKEFRGKELKEDLEKKIREVLKGK